jgi:hypothetical protein
VAAPAYPHRHHEGRQVERLAKETERRLWRMRVVEQRLEGPAGNSP